MKSKDPVFLSSPATLTPAKLTVLPFLTDDRLTGFSQIKKPRRRCFSGEAFCKNPLGHCEYRLAGRLVFLFLLRSLFLGCHEVFPP